MPPRVRGFWRGLFDLDENGAHRFVPRTRFAQAEGDGGQHPSRMRYFPTWTMTSMKGDGRLRLRLPLNGCTLESHVLQGIQVTRSMPRARGFVWLVGAVAIAAASSPLRGALAMTGGRQRVNLLSAIDFNGPHTENIQSSSDPGASGAGMRPHEETRGVVQEARSPRRRDEVLGTTARPKSPRYLRMLRGRLRFAFFISSWARVTPANGRAVAAFANSSPSDMPRLVSGRPWRRTVAAALPQMFGWRSVPAWAGSKK